MASARLLLERRRVEGRSPGTRTTGIGRAMRAGPSIPQRPRPPPPSTPPLTSSHTPPITPSTQARQDLHLDFDPSFVPTPNARNAAMLREAADFAAALKRCEKDIRGVKNAAEGE